MKRLSLGLIFTLLSLILSCGDRKEQSPENPQWAESIDGVNASPYLVVKLGADDKPEVHKSFMLHADPQQDEALEDVSFSPENGTEITVTESDEAGLETSSESYHYGSAGSGCFQSDRYAQCQPIYRKNRHSVRYAFVKRYRSRLSGLVYLWYRRQMLRYYHSGSTGGDGYRDYPYREQPKPYEADDQYATQLIPYLQTLTFRSPPSMDPSQKPQARLGRLFFNDKRFSKNGQVSCGSCHQEQNHFMDQKRNGQGVGTVHRRTPTLVNVAAQTSFFWDGRADSLKAQAKGPIEAPLEHGISRGHVAQLVRCHYQSEYQEIFGAFPGPLENIDCTQNPEGALPSGNTPNISDISGYVWSSIGSRTIKRQITADAHAANMDREDFINRLTWLNRATAPAEWQERYAALGTDEKNAIEQVFDNFAKAIATYESGLVAYESPFDRFARDMLQGASPNQAMAANPGFGEQEYIGLKLFVGQAKCVGCHTGPYFSDQQFHNIGLTQTNQALDIGRAAVLPMGHPERAKYVGAFKTPSLRNVQNASFYMHDGGVSSIRDVLQHYNHLSVEPAVGQRDPRLQPLLLNPEELSYIEAFLYALTSPVRDLSQ